MTDIKLGSSISQKFNNTTNTLTDGPLNYYTEEYSLVDTGNFRQIAIDYKFIKPTGYSDRLQILANDNIIYETNSSIESVLPKPFNLTTFPGVKYKVRFLQSSYVKSSDSFQYNLSLTDKGIAKSISNDGTYINTINDEGTQFRVASTFSNDSGGVIKDIALSLNSKLYGVDTDNKIVRIDPGAPAPTLTTFASQITTIGILTDGSNSSIKDIRTIEFAKDGKLYVVGANDLDSKLHLYRVDNIESRTATLIGNLPEALNTNYNSILTPVYYTIDVENNRLLTISDGNLWQVPLSNPSSASKIGTGLGLPSGSIKNLVFEGGNLIAYNTTSGDIIQRIKIDLTTGKGVKDGNISGNLKFSVYHDTSTIPDSLLNITPTVLVNNAPIASKPLVNASATQDKPFTLALPAAAFTDPDAGDVLTYSATLADGTSLPAWLKLDVATGTFTGTPTSTNLGNFQVKVTASDKAKATAISTFALNVQAPPNNAPVVSKPLVNASATQDKPFTLALPAGTFTDPDAGDVLTYSATLANGTVLPTWLKLDAATGTFTGTPTSTNLGSLQVKVTATDKAQATANSTFALDVVKSPVIPNQPLTLQKASNDGIWNINGSGKVKVSLLSKNTTQLNEIGIFKVDANNKVNGIAPNGAGFAKAAIESGSVVFDVLSDRTTDGLDLSRSFQVNDGDRLGFFLVSNGSIEEDLKTNNFSNVTTSADPVNPYIVAPFQVLEQQGAYTLDWKQGNKDLSLNFTVDNTPNTPLSSISSLQGQPEGEVLDLRGFAGQSVQASFTLKREAGYNDSVSFYKIDDAAGTVTALSGQKLRPGDSGYIQAALANEIVGLNLTAQNGQTVTVDKVLQGGSLYAPILITNVTADRPTGDNVFTAFSLGNADRTDHIRLLGGNTFGFEDLFGGGDKDFNDVIAQASFKTI
jgi:hypothetical protein